MSVGVDGGGGHMSVGMDRYWDANGDFNVLLDGDGDSPDDGPGDGFLDDDLLINGTLDDLVLWALHDHGFVNKDALRHEDGFVDILVDDDLSVDGERLVHDFNDILVDENGLDLVDVFRDSVVLVVLGRSGVRGKGISSVDRGSTISTAERSSSEGRAAPIVPAKGPARARPVVSSRGQTKKRGHYELMHRRG